MKFWSLTLFCLLPLVLQGQDYQADSFEFEGQTLRFRYLEPHEPSAPVLLFLHGSGERGHDNQAQLAHGSEFLAQFKGLFRIIVPQCPADDYWSSVERSMDTASGQRHFAFQYQNDMTWAMRALVYMLDSLQETCHFDTQLSVIGGLSMGGMGAFELVYRRPGYFKKAFPICGGGDPTAASTMQHTGWWIFHGLRDDVVSPEHSQIMYQALLKAGAKSRLTEYPEANHNSWDSAFQESGLPLWLWPGIHSHQ